MQQQRTKEETDLHAGERDVVLRQQSLGRQPMMVMFSWVPFAVVLPISAMLPIWFIKIEQSDRTILLTIQYCVWMVASYLMLAAIPGRDPRLPAQPSRITQLLAVFMLALVFTTAQVWLLGIRADISAVLLQTLALLFLTLPYFVFERASITVRVDRAVLWVCHFVLGLSLFSVIPDFAGLTNYEIIGGRYFGWLGDGVAWALTFPFIMYFATNRISLAALAGLGLALTGSRGPAFISVAALLLLMVFSKGRRFQYGAMIGALVLVGLYQAGLFATLIGRFSDTHLSSNDRTVTASLGVKIFKQSPIFGSGYNSLPYFYPSTGYRLEQKIMPAQTSQAVQILSDGGLITFIPYFFLTIALTAAGIWLMRKSHSLAYGSLANGVAAWLLAMLWLNQSAVWFNVGSYVAPLVFAAAGVVAGSAARLRLAELADHSKSVAMRMAITGVQ